MAAPKYGNHTIRGKQLYGWITSPDGACPVPPCTLVIDEFAHEIFDDDDTVALSLGLDTESEDTGESGTAGESGETGDSGETGTGESSDPSYGGETTSSSGDKTLSSDDDPGSEGEPGEGEGAEGGEDPGEGEDPEEGEDDEEEDDKGPYKNAWEHVERMTDLFQTDLFRKSAAEWVPTFGVEKSEDWKYMFPANTREQGLSDHLATFPGGVLPAGQDRYRSWRGITSNRCIVLNYLKRNYDQPPISEVTNAIYSHLHPDWDPEYVFLHHVENVDTKNFITTVLYPKMGLAWPPEGWDLHVFNDSEETEEEYYGLLGTVLGRTVAYFVLGRYPRGSCTINSIQIAISDVDSTTGPMIDMMFELIPTKDPHPLRKAKLPVGPGPAFVPKPAPGPVPPAGGKAPGPAVAAPVPVPPPGGKPAGPGGKPAGPGGKPAGPGGKPPGPAIAAAAPVPPPGGKPLGPGMPFGPGGKPPGPAIAAAAPVPPPGGKPLAAAIAAAAPVPPPGGKPIATAVAVAAAPKNFQEHREKILKRKADELQDAENDKRYGKTRSGLVRQRK